MGPRATWTTTGVKHTHSTMPCQRGRSRGIVLSARTDTWGKKPRFCSAPCAVATELALELNVNAFVF